LEVRLHVNEHRAQVELDLRVDLAVESLDDALRARVVVRVVPAGERRRGRAWSVDGTKRCSTPMLLTAKAVMTVSPPLSVDHTSGTPVGTGGCRGFGAYGPCCVAAGRFT